MTQARSKEADPDIVGRALELEAVDGFLNRVATADGGSSALLVEGEAGIGKSSLWRVAVARAQERSILVLKCAPAAAEEAFSFAALRDLLDGLPADASARLPEPQRQALGVALLQLPTDGVADPGVLCAALTSVIREAAAIRPTIVAIDDAQWLDSPTARALAFVVRRLGASPVGFLLTRRTGEDARLFADTEAALAERAHAIRLGPIGFGALHRLLTVRTGHRFARPVVARIERMSAGNPMTALEIARTLLESDTTGIDEDVDLPVPERLRELLNARLARLDPSARSALLLAAALSHPTVGLIGAASDDEDASTRGLIAAEAAGIVAINEDDLRFTHPLFASVVQAASSPALRRATHQRLAAVVASDEERAYHLGLAATVQDAAVADLLEVAAVQTYHSGAPDTGARLLARAAALTPTADVDARGRRVVLEAEALMEAGDLAGSVSVLEAALDWIPAGRRMAEALLLLGTGQWCLGRPQVTATLERALAETSIDATLRGRINSRLALFDDDLENSRAHARAAVGLIDAAVDPSALAFAMFGCFYADVLVGRPPDVAMFDQALVIEPPIPSWEVSTIPALWWKYTDQLDLARTRLDRHIRWARDSGDESSDADLYAHLAELELYAGRWSAADDAADRSLDAAEQMGQSMPNPSHRVRALVDVHLGRLDRAIPAAQAGIAAIGDTDPELGAMYLDVLGTAHVAAADDASAVRSFDRMAQLIEARGVREPLRHRTEPDHIEALLGMGATERATRLLSRLLQRHERMPRPWITAALPRLQALVHAAGGDVVGASDALADLLTDPARDADAYASARALLVLGILERRIGRRRLAGERLDQAVALFDALPAPVWAARARLEIERLGRHRGAGEALTPAETRVVELSARGLTNRAVAEQLVISPKTVEAHLARAYTKLGISSRAELGRRLASATTTSDESGLPKL